MAFLLAKLSHRQGRYRVLAPMAQTPAGYLCGLGCNHMVIEAVSNNMAQPKITSSIATIIDCPPRAR
jgi:hypothetical protein